MAQGIDFPERNDYIGKPDNQSNHQCYALPIARMITYIPGVIPKAPPEATLAHISCWQLTPEELEEVKRTGKVYVKVQGTTTYPLSVHGVLPVYQYEEGVADHILTPEQVERLKRP